MVFEFRLPDIGEGVAEGEVVKWFVKEGETVAEDAPLVSVLTDKANVEIPSPKSGRILKLHASVGEKVKVGGLLVSIDAEGPGAPAVQPAPLKPASSSPAASTPARSAPEPAAGSRVIATPYLRRLAVERGIDLATIKGSGPGGRIQESDLSTPTPAVVPARGDAPSTLAAVTPSAEPSSRGAPDAHDRPTRVPIRGIRRVIADHMSESVHRAAHFTYVEEIDVTELIRLRDRMAKHIEKHEVKLSFLPFIIKAVVAGLRAQPSMNATMDDATQELVLHSTYNIGIATAAPEGLLVPVLHEAETKSVTRLAREIQELAQKGREGKLTRAEMTGGTFTITSLGALGGILATPILNYPEVGILGVHKIVRRPSYQPDGTIAPADLMHLSLSLDHRVLDGVVGAQFMAVVKSSLEDPHQLFAEMA